jgi:hypothetical protein
MKRFLESSPVIALEYMWFLNKTIYNSKDKMRNPYWQQAWNDFFTGGREIDNFQIFLETPTGEKWLQSELGKMYLTWQNG